MNKKTRTLVDALIGCVTTAIMAVVTYVNPDHAALWNTAIGIVDTAVVFILNLFTEKEQAKN